jgi:hypothetical protein
MPAVQVAGAVRRTVEAAHCGPYDLKTPFLVLDEAWLRLTGQSIAAQLTAFIG